jgi:N-acetylneuraminic acid mutarotase
MVLVAGGANFAALASSELYDPATGTWTTTGSLQTASFNHTATLLANDRVLVTGGEGDPCPPCVFSRAELYNPATGTWMDTGSLANERSRHTATLLGNDKVLVAGGLDNSNNLASAELYDPVSGTWTGTGSLATSREIHTATLLPNGNVLVTGGFGDNGPLASAELYDPASGTWTATGSLATARFVSTATLLPNGKVLAAGGQGDVVGLPVGTVFTAINNTSATPIDGTFSNLADGSIITLGQNSYQISYSGGDGNDLTLTVVP